MRCVGTSLMILRIIFSRLASFKFGFSFLNALMAVFLLLSRVLAKI